MTELERKARRNPWYWALACTVLLVSIIAMGFAVYSESKAASTEQHLAGSCPFFRDIATAPIDPGAKPLGLIIVADSRKTYIQQGCEESNGKLPAADKRLYPYLPLNMR